MLQDGYDTKARSFSRSGAPFERRDEHEGSGVMLGSGAGPFVKESRCPALEAILH